MPPIKKIALGVALKSTSELGQAFQKRYQVFVSSTYEDLQDERKEVIQAILETRGIPVGMELFPATSAKQLDLIKRIIRESDYYVVIVGGRYGSLNEDGIGYTEAEFDYAVEIGKPVLGFYHRNPISLPGTKLDEIDLKKVKLAAFVSKVKSRVCKSWLSPAELGSAVKSALIHEIEHNPQPGWIRANAAVPNAEVEELKQKINNLETKLLKKQKQLSLPDGDSLLDFVVKVSYDYQKVKGFNLFDYEDKIVREPQKFADFKVSISWDELMLLLGNDLEYGTYGSTLTSKINERVLRKVPADAIKKIVGPKGSYESEVVDTRLEDIMNTWMAKKLVNKNFARRWQLSRPGQQYLAELKAVRI